MKLWKQTHCLSGQWVKTWEAAIVWTLCNVKVFIFTVLPHIRWKTCYQGPFLKLFTSLCLWSALLCWSLVWLMQWNSSSWLQAGFFPPLLFFRRSGEWTHADWLCDCVKGYPTSCRPSLSPDSRSRKSWISRLCLSLRCVCAVCGFRKESDFLNYTITKILYLISTV